MGLVVIEIVLLRWNVDELAARFDFDLLTQSNGSSHDKYFAKRKMAGKQEPRQLQRARLS
jgi:hypothetical protein